jgi:lipopolysaccharide/colanic/teichoic acid biosynthesis glycosyltransferase
MADSRPVAARARDTTNEQARAAESASSERPSDPRRAVVFGLSRDVPRALEHPAFHDAAFSVVGVVPFDDDPDVAEALSALEKLVLNEGAGTILAAGPVGHELMARVSDLALVHRRRLVAVMPTEVLASHEPIVVWEGESPLVQLSRQGTRGWESSAKRVLDVLGASFGLIVAAPLLALAALAIRLESPGSPVFRHWRVGVGRRTFACLKLRTMRADAEEILAGDRSLREAYERNDYKLPDDQDPRVTPVGRFLRRLSLDEVPQLWNVLVGDMSLVGPRPVVAQELEHYEGTIDVLLSVRPGLTGAWAVSGRHHVAYPRRAELELAYIRRWSLAEDARILLRTPGAVFDPGTGAIE